MDSFNVTVCGAWHVSLSDLVKQELISEVVRTGSKKKGPQWDSAALKEELNKGTHFSHVQCGLCRKEPDIGISFVLGWCHLASAFQELLTPQSTWSERTVLQWVSVEPSIVFHMERTSSIWHWPHPETTDAGPWMHQSGKTVANPQSLLPLLTVTLTTTLEGAWSGGE